MSKFKTGAVLAAFTILALSGGAYVAGEAIAAPWAGWTDGQQMEFRLLASGVNRQFQPEIVATANEVCAILRNDPTWDGKQDALEHLVDVGYFEWQKGRTLGVMVDVTCPDMAWVIR